VRVVDLATRNGVFVRISRPEVVFPGDRFLLGHHLLRLENIPPAGREPELGADGQCAASGRRCSPPGAV
jgi:hypothetical protein